MCVRRISCADVRQPGAGTVRGTGELSSVLLIFTPWAPRLGVEKTSEAIDEFAFVARFAVPDDQDFPTELSEREGVLSIALEVTLEFHRPVARVRFRGAGIKAVSLGMHVPETAVNEDDLLRRSEHQIGLARQIFAMEAIAIAERGDSAADDEFGLGVRGLDRRHIGRAAALGDFVSQSYRQPFFG